MGMDYGDVFDQALAPRGDELPPGRAAEILKESGAEEGGGYADVFDAALNPAHVALKMKAAQDEADSEDNVFRRPMASTSVPFGSSVISFAEKDVYRKARERIAAKDYSNLTNDASIVAQYEQEQKRQHDEGTGASVLRAVAHIPAIIGEAAMAGGLTGGGGAAGGITGGVGRLLGLAPKAAAVAGEVAPLTVRGAVQGAGAWLIKTPIQTALMPSMWLPQTQDRAIEKGGDWSDLKNIGPAYAIGNMQVGLLGLLSQGPAALARAAPETFAGSLGGSGIVPWATRLMAGTGTGMAGQEVIDTASHLAKWKSDWGTMANLAAGREGSMKHFVVQTSVFAVFSALHAHVDPTARAAQVTDAATDLVNDLKAKGFSEEATGKQAQIGNKYLMDRMQQKNQMKYEDLPKPVQKYVDAVEDAIDIDTLTKEQAEKPPDVKIVANKAMEAGEVVKPGEAPKPMSPGDAIAALAGGAKQGAAEQAARYAQRIINGEKPETVLEGLNPEGATAKATMAKVAEMQGEAKGTPQTPPAETSAPSEANALTTEEIVDFKQAVKDLGFGKNRPLTPEIEKMLKDAIVGQRNAPKGPQVIQPEAPAPEAKPEAAKGPLTLKAGEEAGEMKGVGKSYRHAITDSGGEEVGSIIASDGGETVNITIAQGKIGTGSWRGLMKSLAEQYPNAKAVEFIRTTGHNAGKAQRITLPGRAKMGAAPPSADPFEALAKHGILKETAETTHAVVKTEFGKPAEVVFRGDKAGAEAAAQRLHQESKSETALHNVLESAKAEEFLRTGKIEGRAEPEPVQQPEPKRPQTASEEAVKKHAAKYNHEQLVQQARDLGLANVGIYTKPQLARIILSRLAKQAAPEVPRGTEAVEQPEPSTVPPGTPEAETAKPEAPAEVATKPILTEQEFNARIDETNLTPRQKLVLRKLVDGANHRDILADPQFKALYKAGEKVPDKPGSVSHLETSALKKMGVDHKTVTEWRAANAEAEGRNVGKAPVFVEPEKLAENTPAKGTEEAPDFSMTETEIAKLPPELQKYATHAQDVPDAELESQLEKEFPLSFRKNAEPNELIDQIAKDPLKIQEIADAIEQDARNAERRGENPASVRRTAHRSVQEVRAAARAALAAKRTAEQTPEGPAPAPEAPPGERGEAGRDIVAEPAFGQPLTPGERSGQLGGGQENRGGVEPIRAKPRETALANAKIAEERAAMDLTPLQETVRKADPVTYDRAMETLKNDPRVIDRLLDELVKKPRQLTDEENVLMLHRRTAMQNEYDRTIIPLTKLYTTKGADPAEIGRLEGRERILTAEFEKFDQAMKEAGTEWGRAGRMRRMLMKEDFSLKGLMGRKMAAKGRALTPEEMTKVADQAARIKMLEEEVAKYERGERPASERPPEPTWWKKAWDWLTKPEEGPKPPSERVSEAKVAVDQAWQKFGKLAKGRLYSNPVDPEMIGAAVGLAKAYVNLGIAHVADFIAAARQQTGVMTPELEQVLTDAWTEAQRPEGAKPEATGKDAEPALNRLRQKIDSESLADRWKNKPLWEKAADVWVKVRRNFVLSSPVILGKLSGATFWQQAVTPIRKGVQTGIGLAFPRFRARTMVEHGFSLEAEGKSWSEGFWTGIPEAMRKLRTGQTNFEAMEGKMPHGWGDLMDTVHAATKTPLKTAAGARASVELAKWAYRNGLDPNEPAVKLRIAAEVVKEANRGIFFQDNFLQDMFQSALKAAEKPDPTTGRPSVAGKLTATGLRGALPVTKTPTNLVIEGFTYLLGGIPGSIRLARAYARGIESLPPEQADSIMRQLSKGSVGAALLAAGFFGTSNNFKAGGYYQPGEKRDEGDVPVGGLRVFGMDIPKYLVHNPAIAMIQIGATARRIVDTRDKTGESPGTLTAIGEATLGLAEEMPFVREPLELNKAFDKNKRPRFIGQQVKSLAIPAGLSWSAEQIDRRGDLSKVKRKIGEREVIGRTRGRNVTVPASTGRQIKEEIQSGVPWWREELPAGE